MYEGERIRKEDLWVELAGPKAYGFELSLATPMDQIQDGKVTVVGPDLKDIKEGSTIPFGMIFKVGARRLRRTWSRSSRGGTMPCSPTSAVSCTSTRGTTSG